MLFSYSRPQFSKNVSTSQPFSATSNPVLQANPVLPAFPVLTRTMQITLPENATHIVICTASNERKEIQLPRFAPINPSKQQQQHQQQVLKKKPLTTVQNSESSRIVVNKKTNSKLEHSCCECGKKYSTSSNLARHKQTHR